MKSAAHWVAITGVYAAIVSVLSVYHEPWRDEVVALSMARASSSLAELWRLVGAEGHPILWSLCLRYAYLALGSTAALKVVSVVVAVAAMGLFLARAPLPPWLKILFTFSWLPLYEFSVVARMYGLGMLWLFGFCALYPSRRDHPVGLALLLVALANTHAFGFLLALAAAALVVVDAAAERETPMSWPRAGVLRGVVVYAVGLAGSVLTTLPDESTLPIVVFNQDLRTIAAAIVPAVLTPARHAWLLLGLAPSLWLWLFLLTLVHRPGVLCFAAVSLIGFELFFTLVLPPNPSRIGYILIVVMATLWLDAARPQEVWPRWPGRLGGALRVLRRWLVVPLVATLLLHVVIGIHKGVTDLLGEHSSSRRLAMLIEGDPRLRSAIVIGEPERRLEALPYYIDNRIYLPQERVFRRWVKMVRGRRMDFSLTELLGVARELREDHGAPVVIALGWPLDGPEVQRMYEGTPFEATFVATAAERAEFGRQTERLASLRSASLTDENYDVYVFW